MSGGSLREMKRRIGSIKNTQQITKAMKMVAAAKLRKAQEKAESSRPYTETLQATMARVAEYSGDVTHPLLAVREDIVKVGYIVITSDRGMCGAYNTNIIKAANEKIAYDETERKVVPAIVAVGRKARDFYRKRAGLEAEYINLGDNVAYPDAREIAGFVMDAYAQEELDEVHIIYSKFINALRQIPTVVKILPIEHEQDAHAQEQAVEANWDYIFEPSAEELMVTILPKYVSNVIYHAMMEGKASEMGAKMTAMDNATKNAKELIENLTLAMNKARQAAITDELLDIVGGSEALKKGGK